MPEDFGGGGAFEGSGEGGITGFAVTGQVAAGGAIRAEDRGSDGMQIEGCSSFPFPLEVFEDRRSAAEGGLLARETAVRCGEENCLQ